MTSIVLAIVAIYSIKGSKETSKFMIEDTILQNRPYMAISTEAGEVKCPNDDKSLIQFTFALGNAGKTPAIIEEAEIQRALIARTMNQEDYVKLKSDTEFGKKLNIEVFQGLGAITVFPDQCVPLGVFNVRSDNLHQDIINGFRRLYLEFSIRYSAMFFQDKKRQYTIDYDMVFNLQDNIYTKSKVSLCILRNESNEIRKTI